MMFRHVSHVFLFLFSGLCSTAVNAQDQIIPRPVSVKVEAKGAATPVKLDEGMKGTMADYQIGMVSETPLMDVYPYSAGPNDKPEFDPSKA